MRSTTCEQFDWSGNIESLEDRLVMSADPLSNLLGGQIQHHAIVDDLPSLSHHVVAEQPPAIEHHQQPPAIEHHRESPADFWIDSADLRAIDEELGQIEQSLANAHNQSGLTQVRADYGFTGAGQTVAVIDSGIAYDHFALGGGFGSNYRVVGGWDFTGENDADPYDDGSAGSHGTHVSGIIGADSGSNTGVAPGVDLVGLRVFDDAGDGYFSWVENALQWVHDNRNSFENPITAVNLSLGVATWNSDAIPSWANLENEFNLLKQDGIFISVSAGNSFTSFNTTGLSYPAASPYVVPVASVDDNGQLSYYSQRNDRVIAAPGRGIVSTVPDYKGNNNGIVDDYASFSGTSMAAPYVAGASVIIREAMEFVGYTNINQDTIYNHMIATADSFYDSATDANYNRLNLETAIDALMPADDFGSTIATAHNLGTINSATAMNGAITTLDDVDYFKFTAASNGSVSFTASTMTHNIDANWDVNGGTGVWSGANNEVLTVDVVAGQQYTVGFSSSNGLGYYDLDIDVSSTFSYTDWGSISFTQNQGITISSDGWYRAVANAAGYFTTEALFDAGGGQINLELYNSNLQLIDSGNAAGGQSRVDTYAAAGEELFIKAIGTNSDVDFRLTNLVSVNGTTVNIAGTTGNDAFTFAAGNTHQVTVNGVSYSFDAIAIATVSFDGQSGSDMLVMTGTSADETASLRVGTATLSDGSYNALAASIENITVHGNGGSDALMVYDSIGDDVYRAWSDHVQMTGSGFSNTAYGFATTSAYASGGQDTTHHYDSSGDDRFRGWHDRVELSGSGFSNYAYGFDLAYAYASSGNDTAYFFDSTGDDRFIGKPEWARMSGNGFFNYAHGFDLNYAYATAGGADHASFYDSAGSDRFIARPDWSRLSGTGFFNHAHGFEFSYAYATAGGVDYSTFYDSPDDNLFIAKPHWARMTGGDFYTYSNGFDYNYAYANSGGVDRVSFYDSAGNDIYIGRPEWSRLTGSGFFNYAHGFEFSSAYAVLGGTDRASLYGSVNSDTLTVRSNYLTLVGNGFSQDAWSFGRTDVYGDAGADNAVFHDLGDSDVFRGLGNSARADRGSFLQEALDFEDVTAIAASDQSPHADLGALDYAFSQVGSWS